MDIEGGTHIILITLCVYFLAIVGLGIYYARRANSTDDFILASHSLSAPFVTGSVVATWLGGAVVLGGATEAFVGGFQAIVWDPWSPVITLLLSGFFLVTIFRRSKFVTAIDFYIARYDGTIGGAGLVVHVLAYISWLSAQFLSLGVIIGMVTGLPDLTATLIGAAIIMTISLTGGLWALSRSDMLAFIILTVVLAAILPMSLDAVGGVSAFIDKAGTLDGTPPFSLFYTNELNSSGEPTGFAGYLGILGFCYMIAAWFSVALGDMGGSVLTSRALAAKNESAATRGFVYGGLVYLVLGMIPVIVGMCAFILRPDFPEAQLDDVFPWFVQNYLPGWLSILFFIAVSSAIVSTAGDTVLTSGALLGYTALNKLKPGLSDRQSLTATRVAMVAVAITSLFVGLALGDIYRLLVFAGAIAFPVLAPSFICGVLWKRANVMGARASVITGAVSWIVLVLVIRPYTGGELWDAIYIASVPAFLLSLTAVISVSLLTKDSCPAKPMRDIEGNDISDTPLFVWNEKRGG